MSKPLDHRSIGKLISSLFRVIALLLVGWIALAGLLIRDPYPLFTLGEPSHVAPPVSEVSETEVVSESPFDKLGKVESLPSSPLNDMIKLGHQLITETSIHIGPLATDATKIYAGNNLACTNCHLEGGTKAFSAPYLGVTGRYPNFRKREGKVGSIEERINGCMERSMNGRRLPDNSDEMRAMVSYMTWLGRGVEIGDALEGKGFVKVELPNRAVDLDHGAQVYAKQCVTCHQEDGQGMKNAKTGLYTYPPLWGPDSYNNGAGMHRVITASQFIKGNMPLGATAENPILTDEEAYDVAGFINSHDRPKKGNLNLDFPDKKMKPMSTPYGPWTDEFSAEQHKFGPFQPIKAYYSSTYGIEKKK